jgi:hypothetical protein
MTIPIGTLCMIVNPAFPPDPGCRWKDPQCVIGRTCTVTGPAIFLRRESRFRYVPVDLPKSSFIAEPCLVPITPPQTDLAVERLTILTNPR